MSSASALIIHSQLDLIYHSSSNLPEALTIVEMFRILTEW